MAIAKRSFTVDEYRRMADAGILNEDDRVELLDGEIVVMSPIYAPHASCVDRLNRLFSRLVGDSAIVRVQSPVTLNDRTEPQPDLVLMRPPMERYSNAHPSAPDILLLMEVADSSLRYDRDIKLRVYAAAGVIEAWIVNLPAARIEVYRKPKPTGYGERQVATRADALSPLALPNLTLPVSEILR